jgi:hypothetical protein
MPAEADEGHEAVRGNLEREPAFPGLLRYLRSLLQKGAVNCVSSPGNPDVGWLQERAYQRGKRVNFIGELAAPQGEIFGAPP